MSDANANDALTVTLDVQDGGLSLVNASGLANDTGTGTVASPLTLTGTTAEIDAALASGVTYTPNNDFTGADTLTLQASDGTLESNQASTAINVAAPSGPTTNTWIGPTSDNEWTDGNNWSYGEYPTSGETALVNSTANPDVDATGSVDNVTLTNDGTITVGATTTGVTFTLDDGTSMTGSGALVIDNGSSATFDDATVTGTAIAVGQSQPFITVPGPLGDSGDGTYARGVNDSGVIVGYYFESEAAHGFIDVGGNYTTLNDPSAGTTDNDQGTYATGISYDGTIVGYYQDDNNAAHGFIATPDSNGDYTSFAELDDPSAASIYSGTYAQAINSSGTEVAGFYYDANDTAQGFIYAGSLSSVDSNAFTTITEQNAGFGGTHVTGINDSGEVVGYYYDVYDNPHGFTSTPDSGGSYTSFTEIDDPFGVHGTYVSGINNAGEIVGYYYDAGSNLHSFLYDNGIYLNLDNPLNAHGTNATAINNSGEAVGFFIDPGAGDNYQGFSVTTPTTLTLSDGTKVSDSALTINAASMLAVENNLNDLGATLDDVNVANSGTIEVDTGSSAVTLTLTDGTTVSGGTLSTGVFGAVDIELGLSGITNPDATLDGVTVYNSGNIGVGASTTATLLLDDGTTVYGGTLSTGHYGTIDIELGPSNITNPDATFDGVTVDNYFGTIEVGDSSLATLLLDDGTTVYGGTLSTGNSGTVDIELGPSDITNPDATFDGVTVDNYFGTIEVSESSAATLLLDDSTTVYGGTLTIGNYGTLDIELGPRNIINPDATLDGVTLYNNSIFGGDIEVGELSSATLLLDDDTTVYGGTVTIGSAGELDIEGGSIPDVTLDGVNVDSNNSIEVGVSSDVTFTLDDGTKFEGGSLTINSGSTLDVEYGSNSFSGAAGAALDNVSVSGSGTILVNSEGNGADLALGGDTLVTGALLSIAALGAIEIGADVSGDDYVSPTLTNLTADNAGTIQIEPNATLLIGGTVTLNGGGTVELMTATEEFAGAIAGAGTGTLDNHNNTIIADGFGTGIGIGDQSLTFINDVGWHGRRRWQ